MFHHITGCDSEGGFRYGFGRKYGAGGNGFWEEQCAQWQAYKVYPELYNLPKAILLSTSK
ncbi:MAG: hypothetical protein IPG00_02930 [Saprospiraceae bacterium]|nr:hypothetical protein [Saprospiraceae bacterium]